MDFHITQIPLSELLAILYGLCVLLSDVTGKLILVRLDNTTVTAISYV